MRLNLAAKYIRTAPAIFFAVLLVAAGGARNASAGSVISAHRHASRASLIKRVPAQLRKQYAHAPDPIMPSAYRTFKPVKGPWKLCFSDAYEGNPWRVRVRQVLERLTKQFAAKGRIKGSLFTAVSNNSVPNQISQIRSMIDQHCSAIISFLGSTKGFDSVIKDAYNHGIPFVAASGSPSSPYSFNADSNWYVVGAQLARGIVSILHGSGNVVMVEGIAGAPVAVSENQGALSVFNKHPGIKVIAQVNGNWTPSAAKSAILSVLATHPGKIDAVWTTGGSMEAAGQAFQQAGRMLPKVITGAGSGYGLGWWHQHAREVKSVDAAIEPDFTAQFMFRSAIRLLEGQHPVINTIMEPIPVITPSNVAKWWRPCMTPSATAAFPVPPTDPLPEKFFNRFFTNGKNTPPYNYKKASLPPC